MAFLKAYINTFINQRKKNFEMHFLTSFPLLSLGILITTHPFVVIIALAADFFPFLGLVTTAASHTVQITYLHTIRCIGEYCLLLAYDPFLPISLALVHSA